MQVVMKWLLRGLALILGLAAVLSVAGMFVIDRGAKGGELALTALLGAFSVWLWRRSDARGRENAARAAAVQAMVDQTVQYFDAVNSAGGFPPARTDRVISSPTREILAACDARLLEMSVQRSSVHLGTKLMLGGVPIYLGKSSPVSSTELREASVGELAVSGDMLFFSGHQKSTEMALSRITSIDVLSDGITLTITGRQRPITFQLANSILWGQLLKNLMQIKVDGRRLPAGAALRAM